MTVGTLPYVDLLDPALDPAGPETLAARQAHWCAHTPMGLAVLRYRPSRRYCPTAAWPRAVTSC